MSLVFLYEWDGAFAAWPFLGLCAREVAPAQLGLSQLHILLRLNDHLEIFSARVSVPESLPSWGLNSQPSCLHLILSPK